MTIATPKRYKEVEFTEEVLQMTAYLLGKSVELAGDEIVLKLWFEAPRNLPDFSELVHTPVSGSYHGYPTGCRVRLKLERVESTSVEVDTEEPAA